MGLDKALAGVDLAGLHEEPPPVDPLGITPFVGHVIGEGAVDHLVVGVAEKAAFGVEEFWVGGVGQGTDPSVLGEIPIGGQPPLALMPKVATREGANGFHRDPIAVGQHEVLRRRDEILGRRNRLIDIMGAHDAHSGAERGVAV